MTLTNRRIKAGNVVQVCPFDTTLTDGSTASITNKPTKDDTAWQLAGQCIDYQINAETEDDEITAFDEATLSWHKDKNTQVTARSIEMTMDSLNEVVWQILYGVDAPLVAGQTVTPFTRLSAGIKCWLRMTKYDANVGKLLILECAGELKVDPQQETNKILRPKLTLDITQTKLNTLTPELGVGYAPESDSSATVTTGEE
jgi:hypothetical protein